MSETAHAADARPTLDDPKVTCDSLELRRRGLRPSYWRGQREVDFVVTTDRGIVPIQVSWESRAERHERALDEFYETFPHAQEALLVGPAQLEGGALAELTPAG